MKTTDSTRRNESFMPNTIHCPSCNRELRVPDELLGKKVKCPACSTTFTASVAGPEAAPPPPAPEAGYEEEAARRPRPIPRSDEYEAEGAEEDYDRPRQPKRFKRGLVALRAPAICLLVTGVLGMLSWGFFGLSMMVQNRADFEAELQRKSPPRNAEEREAQQKAVNFMFSPIVLPSFLVLVLLNLVIVVGSIMMLVGKMRWLGLLASILAMVDCGCCIVGIPFGIWSLIALSNPEAKAAFD
jgi:predicted Zn finger-like uncharacterized protein